MSDKTQHTGAHPVAQAGGISGETLKTIAAVSLLAILARTGER